MWERKIGLPLIASELDVANNKIDDSVSGVVGNGGNGSDSGDGGDGKTGGDGVNRGTDANGGDEVATFGQGDGWRDLMQLIRAQALMRGWLERRAVSKAKAAAAEANERARHIQRRIQRKKATERYFGEGKLEKDLDRQTVYLVQTSLVPQRCTTMEPSNRRAAMPSHHHLTNQLNLGHSNSNPNPNQSNPKPEPTPRAYRRPSQSVPITPNPNTPALEQDFPDIPTTELIERQKVAMRLYESRYASTQRCIAFFVLFHTLGEKVQNFWR